jgi:phospholipid/cholesterol/gamma-HCH transport system substrate-binding protein
MAKRVSPTAIGVFVVASFALVVAALIVVGTGNLFRKPLRFICVFQGDVNGLKVGAAVKFKGVQIGSVSEIRLRLAPSQGRLREKFADVALPVIIDLDESQLIAKGGTGHAVTQPGFEDVVRRGLRAQLKTESFLTGLLYIDLSLHPEAPLIFAVEPGSGPYREIPTMQTKLEAVQEELAKALAGLEEIDFKSLAVSITNAADSIRNLTNSPQIMATLDSLKDTTANLDKTVTSVRVAVDHANEKLDPLVANLQKNSDEVNLTLKQTRAALVDLQSTLDPDSPLAVRLNVALEQLTYTTRSIGELTDYLQQNPSSLVRGKYVPEKER